MIYTLLAVAQSKSDQDRLSIGEKLYVGEMSRFESWNFPYLVGNKVHVKHSTQH